MKDEQLYSLIKKAVRQKKKVPVQSESLTFAERYCQHQLTRKIYNHRSDKTMDSLMKKFNRLETYYDLPELVREIRQIKSKQADQARIKSIKKIELPQETPPQYKQTQSKSFYHLKNLRASIENQYTKLLLNSIETQSSYMNQDLKNNSSLQMTHVDQILKHCNQDALNANAQLFENLQKFLKNEKEFMMNEQNQNFSKKQVNAQEKKAATEYLHKISSYLQIILEKEHKHKWKRKRSSSIFKPNNLLVIKPNKSQHSLLAASKNTILITQNLSNNECIETLKEQTRIIKQESRKTDKHKYLLKKPKSSLYNQKGSQKQSFRQSKSRFKQLSSNLTCLSTMNESVSLMRKQSSLIKENFTFRRRSIKEKIIKKLDKFIGEIDDETFSSKKENGYFNHQINKLENNFKRFYGRYRKATLADQKEIEALKKLAQEFSVVSRKTNSIDEESSLPTEHRISSKDVLENVYGMDYNKRQEMFDKQKI